MISWHWIRRQALSLELGVIRRTAFVRRVPLLRRLHREPTARVAVLKDTPGAALCFRVDFETPYLHLPLEVDRDQIGVLGRDAEFRAEAFRFFDWHSWQHIPGEITWHGEREPRMRTGLGALVTGFIYRVPDQPALGGNLGLRLAEGVPGTIGIAAKNGIVRMRFEPVYWMLAPGRKGYEIISIRDNDLMVLIVSLCEMGNGGPQVRERAIEHLWEWVSSRWGDQDPEVGTLGLLRYVRDWGPLGMANLYPGLKEILDRLGERNREGILFEFYADHWGVRDNRNARLLAVKTLQALGTKAAHSALTELRNYVRYRGLDPAERELIDEAVRATQGGRPAARNH